MVVAAVPSGLSLNPLQEVKKKSNFMEHNSFSSDDSSVSDSQDVTSHLCKPKDHCHPLLDHNLIQTNLIHILYFIAQFC
jgi:hypothetical protein